MSMPHAQKAILQAIADKNKLLSYNEYSDNYNDYNDLSRYYDVDNEPAGRVVEKPNILQRVKNIFCQSTK